MRRTDMANVAVIIVNYRTANLTIDCARSVLASRGVQPHLIIVDNASGDGSVATIRYALPNASVLPLDRNGGYSGGNNAGLQLATELGAEYTLILNSDTILHPDCLAQLTTALEVDQTAAIASPQIFYADPPDILWFGGGYFSLWTGRAVHVGRRRSTSAGLTARHITFATGCALLVRMDALTQIGVFDASLFAYAEDVDWSVRVIRAGRTIRYVPDARLWHLEGVSFKLAGRHSFRIYLSGRNLLRVMRKHARWFQWLTFTPVFLIDFVGRFLLLAIRDRDPTLIGAVFRGVRDGLLGRSLDAVANAPHP